MAQNRRLFKNYNMKFIEFHVVFELTTEVKDLKRRLILHEHGRSSAVGKFVFFSLCTYCKSMI